MEILKFGKKNDGPRLKGKQKMITGAVVAALLAAMAATAIYIANKDSMTIREPVMVSIMGEKEEYKGTTKLKYRDSDEEVILQNGSRTLLLSGVPVYCKESGDVVLSRKMIYSNYDTGLIRRVNHFARVSVSDGVARIRTGGRKEHQLNGGYLFDGRNTYLFLEPVTVSWGTENLELSPLSYISVFNKKGFYYYSQENKQAEYVSSGEEVVRAVSEGEQYSLNMSSDIADLDSGKSFLLSPSPDAFELLK